MVTQDPVGSYTAFAEQGTGPLPFSFSFIAAVNNLPPLSPPGPSKQNEALAGPAQLSVEAAG